MTEARAAATSRRAAWAGGAGAVLAAAGLAAPASAQLAAEASIQTDYRLRGYSLSGERPVAAVSLSYDDPSGLYAGATALGMVRRGEPELLGVQANLGYATRVAPGVSLDGGVYRAEYAYGYGTSRNYHYTELYLGLATRRVTARLRYSPDYFYADTPTLYAEVEAGIEPAPNWFVSAHAGALTYLEKPPPYLPRRTYDWRVGASRQLGRLGIHLDLSGRIQDQAYASPYAMPGPDDDAAVVLSLTRAL
ncbi:MAG TPA: TorF family putative porin [Croceibacterium sp.]|nr:TorF family putative porin [Croceibacterium sp.]